MTNARFKKIEDLAEERQKTVSDMTRALQDKGLAVVDGWYDSVLFEAVFSAPARGEGGTQSLSARTGVGAVQSLVAPLGVRVLVHDCHQAQTLVFRKGAKNTVAKWHYTTSLAGTQCFFQVRGFLREESPTHYFLTCFEGPTAWAIERDHMQKQWKKLLRRTSKHESDDTTFQVLNGHENNPNGALLIKLHEQSSPYLLRHASQLGF
jgi:hypothetical protein